MRSRSRLSLHHVGRGVRGQVLVDERRARSETLFKIHDGVERLDVDHNVAKRVFGDVPALGHDHRDGLADVANFVFRQRHLRAGVKDEIRNRRRRHQHRPGPPVIAQVAGREHRGHAWPLFRRRHIHALQAAVRVIAPHECHVQHAVQLHVIHEERASGEQPRIFTPKDAGVKVACVGRQASRPRRCGGSRCNGRDSRRVRREFPGRWDAGCLAETP